jgi:hypothetical protein
MGVTTVLMIVGTISLAASPTQFVSAGNCRRAYLYHFLNRAASCGDELGARILLNEGADPNGRDYSNYADCVAGIEYSSPLRVAVAAGHANVVRLLLDKGGDPNTLEGEGITPLVEAFLVERLDLARLLLDHGGNPELSGIPVEYRPAEIARRKGNGQLEAVLAAKHK